MAHTVDVTEADLERVREMLRRNYHPRDHEEAQELILGAMQDTQHMLGWVPHEAAEVIGDHLGVTADRIFGLSTFYADFRTARPGQHFMLLCHGTACFVGGSQRLISTLQEEYGIGGDETTADGTLTVQIVNGCLGVCDLAPVIQFDHHRYAGNLTPESFVKVIEEVRHTAPGGHHDAH